GAGGGRLGGAQVPVHHAQVGGAGTGAVEVVGDLQRIVVEADALFITPGMVDAHPTGRDQVAPVPAAEEHAAAGGHRIEAQQHEITADHRHRLPVRGGGGVALRQHAGTGEV